MARNAAILLIALLLGGCAGAPRSAGQGRTLTVFAAASLADAFGALGRQFEATHAGVRVSFNFAGSQQLRGQLAHGARADVFAPASLTELETALASSLIVAGSERILTANRLVLVYPPDNPGRVAGLADLARPGLRLVIAHQSVPAGAYTLALLDQLSADPGYGPDFKARALANVVSYEENVRAVLSKVQLGEADAGVVYVSDARSESAAGLGALPIPDRFDVAAVYPIAPLADAQEPELAREFIELALSLEGRQVLERYGFVPPTPGTP